MRQDIILVACIVLGMLGTIVTIWLTGAFQFRGRKYRDGGLNYVVGDSDMLVLVYFPRKKRVEFVSDSAGWLFGIDKDQVYQNVEYLFQKLNLPMKDDIIQSFCQGTLCISQQREFSIQIGPNRMHRINLIAKPCDRGRYVLTIREKTLEYEMSETMKVLLDILQDEYREKQILLSFLQGQAQPEEEIATACRKVLEMFDEMADLERPLQVASFSIPHLLQEVIDSISGQLEARGQNLEFHMSVIHEMVSGDSEHLRKLLGELLENAVMYTPEGGTVTLSVKQRAETPQREQEGTIDLAIVVEDNGIGIQKEFMQRLFQPFERADDPRVRSVKGNGLGLRIVRTLVERMGGTVKVESEVNHGSRFSVYLEFGIPKETLIKGD